MILRVIIVFILTKGDIDITYTIIGCVTNKPISPCVGAGAGDGQGAIVAGVGGNTGSTTVHPQDECKYFCSRYHSLRAQ